MKSAKPFTQTSFLLGFLAFAVSIFFIVHNITEVFKRSFGDYTLFSQMSWLNDHQAILYCSTITFLFSFLSFLIIKSLVKKDRRRITLLAVLTLAFTIAILVLEPVLLNRHDV